MANFALHTFNLSGEVQQFIYFNANNLLLLFIVSSYYSMRPSTIALTVRNYCGVKVIIELLLIIGVGTINSWYYTFCDIAVIVLTLYYAFYGKKYLRTIFKRRIFSHGFNGSTTRKRP